MKLRTVAGGQMAAEVLEPEQEEGTESSHHEKSPPELTHHQGHNYEHIRDKFLNEITHLPSKAAEKFLLSPFLHFITNAVTHNDKFTDGCFNILFSVNKKINQYIHCCKYPHCGTNKNNILRCICLVSPLPSLPFAKAMQLLRCLPHTL